MKLIAIESGQSQTLDPYTRNYVTIVRHITRRTRIIAILAELTFPEWGTVDRSRL